jgi:hypothetical protein
LQHLNLLSVTFSAEIEAARLLQDCPAVLQPSRQNGTWRLEVAEAQAALEQLVTFSGSEGVRISEINTITASLEDAFMSFLQEGRAEAEAIS